MGERERDKENLSEIQTKACDKELENAEKREKTGKVGQKNNAKKRKKQTERK